MIFENVKKVRRRVPKLVSPAWYVKTYTFGWLTHPPVQVHTCVSPSGSSSCGFFVHMPLRDCVPQSCVTGNDCEKKKRMTCALARCMNYFIFMYPYWLVFTSIVPAFNAG